MTVGLSRREVSRQGFGIKFIAGLAAFAFVMTFAGMTARAAMIELDFTGAEGNQSGGVYTYPYNFNFNGGSQTYELMCDDFLHEIIAPQNWQANATYVSGLNGANVSSLQFPGIGVTGYLEVADLFEEEYNAWVASNSDPEGLYNWAAWDLTSQSDVSASHLSAGDEATVQGYLGAVETLGNDDDLSTSEFSNVIIYTPLDMSPGGPQEFLGFGTPVDGIPEPTTFALLGIGAVGLLGRRRRSVVSI
jgi:hypothetical protein